MITTVFRLTILVVVVTLCVVWTEAADSPSCFCLEKATGGLRSPVEYVSVAGRDNSNLALIVEQRGVIRAFEIKSDGKFSERKTPFLDIRDRVQKSNGTGEERGLLSVVLHPNYSRSGNGRVFVYYIGTSKPGPQDYAHVSEFQATNYVVDVASEKYLLRIKQPSEKGNGGQLLFGDDGYLYIFTGDGSGHAGDSAGQAQNLQSFLGKALRVDVNKQGFERGDSASALVYDTPSSNPFYADMKARPEVFALGFRNPWQCSQDSKKRGGTGDIYCGDTGSDFFEEINVVRKGLNYGWNLKEGDRCINASNCSGIENEGTPLYSYPHSPGKGHAVVGGFVYRGKAFPSLKNSFLYGDTLSGQTFSLKSNTEGVVSSTEWPTCSSNLCPCNAQHKKLPFLLAFGLDMNGELMLLMTSEFSVQSTTGTLFRVIAPTGTEKKPATCSTCKLAAGPLLTLLCALVAFLRHDASVNV